MQDTRSELMSTAPRLGILDGRATIDQIADDMGRCTRAIRYTLDRLAVPYIRLLKTRYYAIDDVRTALLAEPADRAPRHRGRPRKHPIG